MATLFVPSPHALNAMTTRRAPLANVPNATNSPHRAVSTATAATMKRTRPSGLPWDSTAAPPPLKKQLLDTSENVDARFSQRSLNQPQPQAGESKIFTRRTNNQPTAFEKKLAAARDKPKQQQGVVKVNRNLKYCPESIESVRQWQKHYRKVFPSYVFYFESIPEDIRKKYVRQIISLGATEEKFFSRVVTHVVTSRSIPPEVETERHTETTQVVSVENNVSGSVQTVNPSMLERGVDGQLGKTRSRTGLGMIEPDNKRGVGGGSGDLLYRARQMNMKIWPLDKLQRIIFTMNDKELAHILQPMRNGSAAAKNKTEDDLSLALQHEKLHAPAESDSLTLNKGLVPFKGPYLYIWDYDRETRPVVVREYPKVSRKQDGAWPQFRGVEIGKCPFVETPGSRKADKDKDKQKQQQAKTNNTQTTLVTKSMAPPARGPSKLINQQQQQQPTTTATNQDDTESALEDSAGRPFEPMETAAATTTTTNIGPRPVSKGSISVSSLPFKFGGEIAASGIQPSNITSAIRSQMISSTAAAQGAKAGTSKEVHELKRKVLEKSSGIISTTISSCHRADAAAVPQSQPVRMPIARAAKLKAQANDDGTVQLTERNRRASEAAPKKQSGLRKQQASNKKRDSKPGYCENCREKFEDYEDHIDTRKHRKFASNVVNFFEIDAFIVGLNSEGFRRYQ
ncbi:DBF zinc finger domain-containing protein [Nannizzia gypsea CBS 118893]|uniref:DBF zinc finger domain-containing protein n=1 Tax=Arthroderma gypseum (strain ATCC MYA-4604 / CBS 118893) TaxID=535722 RepID=E4V4L5_ARTGP|nr:DBF zinc finger domain-containing protein [Nannizzia gypsea CBS 118893]EFR04939.1 DBF zinc finger domain-containing protein [Nannizzia gypsea CBS 118893]